MACVFVYIIQTAKSIFIFSIEIHHFITYNSHNILYEEALPWNTTTPC